MWDHITDTVVPISLIKDKKLQHLHLTASRKAVTTILDAIAPDVAASIDDDEERSAHHIWKLLEDCYSKGMVIQPYILLTKLVQLSQIGGVGKFISNIECISTESSLMGKPIGPDIKLGCLLCGVQPHLQPYTAAYKAEWESTEKEDLDNKMQADEKSVETQLHCLFNRMSMNLCNHELSAQLKERELDTSTLIMALGQGMQRSQASRSPKSNQEPVCWHCNETGHISPECPNWQGNIGRHKRGGRDNSPGKGGGNGSNAGVAGQALAIMTMGVTADPAHDRWIWDTGADVHICKDKSLMSNLSKIAGTISQAQGPLIKYDTTGNVVLKLHTN
ncbi:uncharacterized protein UBRO_20101 [Ustilago bromivora]|uniref:CCHC-type domain-containing protein n=1 Tax=Ustilago bromivora TaxID=307758 RepID=A0A1K0G7K6_9BASI|nr:uncharacterized protein UBRO_20101 [Ustilago bromivora]SYW73812.1 uncharacterized protein UBRO2_00087 [Ustilago bromivora]